MSEQRCKSTHLHQPAHLAQITGVQCKFTSGHNGPHCGYAGYYEGDVTWADSPIDPWPPARPSNPAPPVQPPPPIPPQSP